MNNKFSIAVHGGAGTILPSQMTPELELRYKQALENAILAGTKILEKGGISLDAVEAAVIELENFPLFNAGKGAVFNHEGKHEMDAAIMNGQNLEAGAVCGVCGIKNPVSLARKVMEQSGHVLLSGKGAELFAQEIGMEMLADDYFYEQSRYEQWQELKTGLNYELDHTSSKEKKFGTVGAVALDQQGNLAAATSTGGMTNKRFGRIGDTPIIGSGTYANNETCAISCTGHGEFFLRAVVAHDISALMNYKGLSLSEACDLVVNQKLVKMGGEGGLIAIDSLGNIELPFNSAGMYRASLKEGEQVQVNIYR